MKYLVGLCMGFLSVCPLFGQGNATIGKKAAYRYPAATVLTIGDKVPDFRFSEVMNYSASSANLSALRSKLTILDFWSTSCSSCIALFPHMQSLKKTFGDDLSIILVNGKTQLWRDTQEKINNLLSRQQSKTGTPITLPIVLNATNVDNAFPWQTIPHEVWINQQGEIVAITGPSEVNEDNIRAMLEGKKLRLHLKQDVDIDLQQTTLQEWYYGPPASGHQAVAGSLLIKGYIDGLHSQGLRFGDPKNPALLTGWYTTNQPLFSLFTQAYANIITVPVSQILVEASHPGWFTRSYKDDSSRYTDAYSYDATLPASSSEDVYKAIQADLRRAFRAEIDLEQRNVKCLVISAGESLNHLAAKSGEKVWQPNNNEPHQYIHGYTPKEIIDGLNSQSPAPLIWQGGFDQPIDLELVSGWQDPVVLKACLEKAGFTVIEETRLQTVPVLKDAR